MGFAAISTLRSAEGVGHFEPKFLVDLGLGLGVGPFERLDDVADAPDKFRDLRFGKASYLAQRSELLLGPRPQCSRLSCPAAESGHQGRQLGVPE